MLCRADTRSPNLAPSRCFRRTFQKFWSVTRAFLKARTIILQQDQVRRHCCWVSFPPTSLLDLKPISQRYWKAERSKCGHSHRSRSNICPCANPFPHHANHHHHHLPLPSSPHLKFFLNSTYCCRSSVPASSALRRLLLSMVQKICHSGCHSSTMPLHANAVITKENS